MRFLVLGAGGLGGYFGGMLLRGGAEVDFLVRPKRAAQLAERGLVIKDPAGDLAAPVKTLRAGEIDHPYDVIFLTCKAYDLNAAIDAIAPAVGPGSAILPVLNGVNHIDILVERFGADRVLGGMILIRAELTPEGDIARPTGAGYEDAAFGELTDERSPRCGRILEAFAAGGLPGRISDHILAEMWEKFCAFAANATICTLTRALAGEIAAAPVGPSFVAAVFEECARVTTAEGFPPSPAMRDLVMGMFSRPDSTYRPSIASDLEAGRPTEGEHTIGDLVRRGERHGLNVPILRAALCNLQVAEMRRQQPPAAIT